MTPKGQSQKTLSLIQNFRLWWIHSKVSGSKLQAKSQQWTLSSRNKGSVSCWGSSVDPDRCSRWQVLNQWFQRAVIWTWGYEEVAGFRLRAVLLHWSTIYTLGECHKQLKVSFQRDPRWAASLHLPAWTMSQHVYSSLHIIYSPTTAWRQVNTL